MVSEFDASEFIDEDLQAIKESTSAPARPHPASSAPTREQVESKVGEMQKKLSELKKAQQELEHERASLEETRRRQIEFTNGRQEMIENLTRGVGLLEEAEFNSRRETEHLAKALAELRGSLDKIGSIREETWTRDNLHLELTRASTTIENARMEWNSARLKFDFLNGNDAGILPGNPGNSAVNHLIRTQNYAELCKVGLALTWPLALVGLALFLLLLLRQG